MANVGILIETDGQEAKPTNYGAITAAQGHDCIGFTFTSCDDASIAALYRYGVKKLVVLEAGGDLAASPDFQAKVLGDAVSHFGVEVLLGVSSPKGMDLMGRMAAAVGAALVQDCIAVDIDARTVVKSHFSGKTLATLKLSGSLCLCGIRPNAIEPVEAPVQGETETYRSSASDTGKVKIKELREGDSSKIDLTEANVIITGGRPIGASENYKILEACAEKLGAAVGASRAAVDAGYAPHSMQVGQTGKTVSPKLYIGCGLSGSVQHFAGMKTSKVIVAINTDKDAPIFNKCDYGIIGDLFEVVPALTEIL